MTKGLWITLMCITMTGCATNTGNFTKTSEVESRVVGMTKIEVAQIFGVPTQRMEIDATNSFWTYRTTNVGLTGGQCDLTVTFQGDTAVKATLNKTDYSPLAAPLGSCSSIIGKLK